MCQRCGFILTENCFFRINLLCRYVNANSLLSAALVDHQVCEGCKDCCVILILIPYTVCMPPVTQWSVP